MIRTVLATGDLAPALTELKHWLGITRSADDAQLTDLIGAAMEACERFTGLTPVASTIEEVMEASHDGRGLPAARSRASRRSSGSRMTAPAPRSARRITTSIWQVTARPNCGCAAALT